MCMFAQQKLPQPTNSNNHSSSSSSRSRSRSRSRRTIVTNRARTTTHQTLENDNDNGNNRNKTRRRETIQLATAALLFFAQARVKSFGSSSSSSSDSNSVNDNDVRRALRDILEHKIQKTKCPAVLRVAFHDAGTFNNQSNDGGMNASVLYELGRPESFGLKRGLNPIREVFEEMKARGFTDDEISLADCIACAGAYAVELTGGPKFLESIPLGRKDANVEDPENRMPIETLHGKEMREHFQNLYGLSSQEMVALSGAHTIGQKGFGDPYTFDNEYFITLKKNPWTLPNLTKDELEMNEHIGLLSDRYLLEDEENKKWIYKYADDIDLFNRDFVTAYIKLTSLGVKY
jgi:L-ascorbate peroxidase